MKRFAGICFTFETQARIRGYSFLYHYTEGDEGCVRACVCARARTQGVVGLCFLKSFPEPQLQPCGLRLRVLTPLRPTRSTREGKGTWAAVTGNLETARFSAILKKVFIQESMKNEEAIF